MDQIETLREALAELAAEGVHRAEQGEVVRGEPPGAGWPWKDGCAPVAKAQRALPRALEAKRREELLTRPSRDDGARLRSAGGIGAGAWLSASPSTSTAPSWITTGRSTAIFTAWATTMRRLLNLVMARS